ncbi:uncharacterized protein LOC106669354 isoform X1 [Cimex lectularius]|uniref:Short neuropeptide F n=1 Tax=Cimex lectularius TaxID=79782 RepID=A0A8I6TG59_CIMLE|nr:uncharacterized protein LOC106669354 isoform X1 [Cimex lectularius]
MKIALPMLGCLCALVILMSPEATTTSLDYDSFDVSGVGDLYEGLKRAAYPERVYKMEERKDNRTPQLRLRFGRRSVPLFPLEERRLDQSRMDYFSN